jgi:hypothetical protein
LASKSNGLAAKIVEYNVAQSIFHDAVLLHLIFCFLVFGFCFAAFSLVVIEVQALVLSLTEGKS